MNESNYRAGYDPYGLSRRITYKEEDFSLEEAIVLAYTNSNCPIHTVVDGETLQSIAYFYYKDSGYWLHIARANEIFNPFNDTEFYPGKRLIIPLINNG